MAGICFFYEHEDVDVWSGKKLDAWHYACKAAGDIDSIIVINLSDREPECPSKEYNFHVVQSIAEAEELMEGHVTQVVCPWNFFDVFEVWDYDHDTDWYIFGPASGWCGVEVGQTKITIQCANEGAALHSVHAATVVLTSRYRALG